MLLEIVVTVALIHLATGATLWALVLHPLDQARAIPLAILTWPRDLVRIVARGVRELRDIEQLRRHCR